jgi:hypothetical protein
MLLDRKHFVFYLFIPFSIRFAYLNEPLRTDSRGEQNGWLGALDSEGRLEARMASQYPVWMVSIHLLPYLYQSDGSRPCLFSCRVYNYAFFAFILQRRRIYVGHLN